MSKLERLNARVSKLLTVAVQEVLEVVKETVSEYQDKTARTQRENESLKKKLQELQETLRRNSLDSKSSPCFVTEREAEIEKQHDVDLSFCFRHGPEPDLPETKPVINHKLYFEERNDFNELELENALESEAECNLEITLADTHTVHPYERIQIDEPKTLETSLSEQADTHTDFTGPLTLHNKASTSYLNSQQELNRAVIKTEPEPTECTSASEVPNIPGTYDCVDLSCNSTRPDPVPQKSPVCTGPYGLVYVHSNSNAGSRRYGFLKSSRGLLDSRKHRREFFRRDEPHICFVCGKTFSRVGNLRIHQRCHTGEKPYGCLQCGRCFSQAGDLKKHKRVHTGEKPYYCNQCGKSFSRGENLKRHQKIHIGESMQLQQAGLEKHSRNVFTD